MSFSVGQGVGVANSGIAGLGPWFARIEGAISTHSYLVGQAITLADLAVFFRSYPLFSSMPPSRRMAAPVAETGRWFDQIQNQTRKGASTAGLSVLKIERVCTNNMAMKCVPCLKSTCALVQLVALFPQSNVLHHRVQKESVAETGTAKDAQKQKGEKVDGKKKGKKGNGEKKAKSGKGGAKGKAGATDGGDQPEFTKLEVKVG